MPIYDAESFDKSLIPNHFRKETTEIFEIAVMLGWKFHVTGAQSVTLISWDERKKYHFGRRDSTPMNRVRRDLIRYAEPEKLALADAMAKDERLTMTVAPALPVLGQKGTVIDDRPKPQPKKRAEVREPAVVDSDSESKDDLHIVRESPMIAKASENKGYESKVATERLWSDGSTDYKCVECDYTSVHRLSVRSHRQVHIRKGVEKAAKEQPRFAAEVPDAVIYKPRQNRIDALAAHLLEALDSGKTVEQIAGEVARESLLWVHEQSKKGTVHAAEREDLTPEDTLNRIKSLLDDGSFLRHQQEMKARDEQVAGLQEELAQVKKRMEAAEHKAESARQTLKAFTDLATELSSSESESEVRAG